MAPYISLMSFLASGRGPKGYRTNYSAPSIGILTQESLRMERWTPEFQPTSGDWVQGWIGANIAGWPCLSQPISEIACWRKWGFRLGDLACITKRRPYILHLKVLLKRAEGIWRELFQLFVSDFKDQSGTWSVYVPFSSILMQSYLLIFNLRR